jgi:hypothetical protein
MGMVYDATSGVYYATLSAAITGSSADDVLQVPAGSYVENFPDITHSLTINAVGGLAYLSNPQPDPPNGRAILNVPGNGDVSLTVSGLAISGANNDPSVSNPTGPTNAAAILFESGNDTLTVQNSWIHNNEDGILTGGADAASVNGMYVVISNSEIDNNGAPSTSPMYGYDHNIYAGALTQLTVTDSYIHDALGGSEIKSRALRTVITNNRIQDGPTAQTSYSIDFADGGNDVVTGNVIEKGASAVNRYIIHFGGEGTYAGSSLLVSGNSFINDRTDGATAVFNQTQDANNANIPATITGNTFYNIASADLFQDAHGPPYDIATSNIFSTNPAPPLDTSPGYATPEPGSFLLLSVGLLRVAMLRHKRRRRAFDKPLPLSRARLCARSCGRG